MRPVIGISAGNVSGEFRLNGRYVAAVKNAGGAPVVLTAETDVMGALAVCDGILLSGGGDISPSLCGITDYDPVYLESPDPMRDRFELALARKAFEHSIPTFGICRGLQVMNTALGGTLIFHIDGHMQKTDRDQPSHGVFVGEHTRLRELICKSFTDVNSFHHQVIDKISPHLTVNAVSHDGRTEGAEAAEHPFYLGVQWHPEHMEGHSSDVLFAAFCAAAKKCR